MQKLKVKIFITGKDRDLPLPSYMSDGASGMDLHAAVDVPVKIQPGEILLIPTGIRVAIPEGFEAQIRPRSGLALKYGITVVNAPGTIDSDYRGEIKVILTNMGQAAYIVRRGDRIAQMVFQPVIKVQWEEVEKIEATVRGEKGFGHTG